MRTSFKVLINKVAQADYNRALNYYDKQSPAIGGLFYDNFDAALTRLTFNPERFSGFRFATKYRRIRVGKFSELIIFRIWPRRNSVRVAGVWNEKRDPDSIRKRLVRK